MSDQEWEVGEFVARVKAGELDDSQLGQALDLLSPEQMDDLQNYLLMQGESRNWMLSEDLKRTG